MKNIAIIIQKLTGGGAEKTAAYISDALSNHYNCYIIVFSNQHQTYQTKAKIIDLNLPARKNIVGKFINLLKRVKKIKQIKKKFKISHSISLMFGANLVNVLSKNKEKLIISERNVLNETNKGFFNTIILKYIFRKTHHIIAISEEVNAQIISLYPRIKDKSQVIYNMVDISKESLVSEITDFKFDSDNFYFINIGRLTHQKGQVHLIRSFSKVKSRLKNVKLLILGQGELEEKLKSLALFLGVDEDVIFLGYQNNPYPYLAKSNAFVLSSLYEGLGNVLLEAMYVGLPVISTDCKAGPREILTKNSVYNNVKYIEFAEYGILTSPINNAIYENLNNPYYTSLSPAEEDLCYAMIEIFENKELNNNYRKKSIERIQDFSKDVILSKWIELIESD